MAQNRPTCPCGKRTGYQDLMDKYGFVHHGPECCTCPAGTRVHLSNCPAGAHVCNGPTCSVCAPAPVAARMSDDARLVARRNAILDLRDARINEIMAGSFPATGEVLSISPERVQALLAQAYTAGRLDVECGLPAMDQS